MFLYFDISRKSTDKYRNSVRKSKPNGNVVYSLDIKSSWQAEIKICEICREIMSHTSVWFFTSVGREQTEFFVCLSAVITKETASACRIYILLSGFYDHRNFFIFCLLNFHFVFIKVVYSGVRWINVSYRCRRWYMLNVRLKREY